MEHPTRRHAGLTPAGVKHSGKRSAHPSPPADALSVSPDLDWAPSDGHSPDPDAGSELSSIKAFSLVLDLDGNVAVARWSPYYFACDPSLLQLASILAGLDEVVGMLEGGREIRATTSKHDPLGLLMTLLKTGGSLVDCKVEWRFAGHARSTAP